MFVTELAEKPLQEVGISLVRGLPLPSEICRSVSVSVTE